MLTVRQQLLASIASEWDGIDMNTFQERLLLQKRIFFISMLGIDLGYKHSWYLKGPYSPALTRDGFAIAEAIQAGNFYLKELPAGVLTQVRDVIGRLKSNWGDARRMELMASVYYLATKNKDLDEQLIAEKLSQLKIEFSKEEAIEAFTFLHTQGLLKDE